MAIWSVILFFWGLFVHWLLILIAPIRSPELLWITIPIWLNWFFAEWFQEKKSTSFGNAISNGVVVLWVGIDWSRFLIRLMNEGKEVWGYPMFFKFSLAFLAFVYGLVVIVEGIRTKKFIHYVGRIRDVTYVLVMFTPVIYGVIDFDWKFLLAALLGLPVFYGVIEFIDRITPDPETYKEDEGGGSSTPYSDKLSSPSSTGSDLGGLGGGKDDLGGMDDLGDLGKL